VNKTRQERNTGMRNKDIDVEIVVETAMKVSEDKKTFYLEHRKDLFSPEELNRVVRVEEFRAMLFKAHSLYTRLVLHNIIKEEEVSFVCSNNECIVSYSYEKGVFNNSWQTKAEKVGK